MSLPRVRDNGAAYKRRLSRNNENACIAAQSDRPEPPPRIADTTSDLPGFVYIIVRHGGLKSISPLYFPIGPMVPTIPNGTGSPSVGPAWNPIGAGIFLTAYPGGISNSEWSDSARWIPVS